MMPAAPKDHKNLDPASLHPDSLELVDITHDSDNALIQLISYVLDNLDSDHPFDFSKNSGVDKLLPVKKGSRDYKKTLRMIWSLLGNIIDALDQYWHTPVRIISATYPNTFTSFIDTLTDKATFSLLAAFGGLGALEAVFLFYRDIDRVNLRKTLEKIRKDLLEHRQGGGTTTEHVPSTMPKRSAEEIQNLLLTVLNQTLAPMGLFMTYEYKIVDGVIRLCNKAPEAWQERPAKPAEKPKSFLQKLNKRAEDRIQAHEDWLNRDNSDPKNRKKAGSWYRGFSHVASFFEGLWEKDLWKVIATYPMMYWIIWMAGLFTSSSAFVGLGLGISPVAPIVLFTVAAVPGFLYLAGLGAVKLYKYIKRNKSSEKKLGADSEISVVPKGEAKGVIAESNSIFYWNALLLGRRYQLKSVSEPLEGIKSAADQKYNAALLMDSYEQYLIDNSIVKVPDGPWQRLQKKHRNRFFTAMSAIGGFFYGIIWVEFFAWVLQDFSTQFFLGAGATAASAPIPTIAIFAVGVAFGIGMMVYNIFTNKETREKIDLLVKNLRDKESNYKKHVTVFDGINQLMTAHYKAALQKIADARKIWENLHYHSDQDAKLAALDRLQKRIEQQYQLRLLGLDEDNDSSFNNREQVNFRNKVGTYTKKILNRAKVLVGRFGTGVLIGRFIFSSGGLAVAICTAFGLVSISSPVSIGLMLGIGAVYAVIKLVQHHYERQHARDVNYLRRLEVKTKLLTDKTKYNMEVEQQVSYTHKAIDVELEAAHITASEQQGVKVNKLQAKAWATRSASKFASLFSGVSIAKKATEELVTLELKHQSLSERATAINKLNKKAANDDAPPPYKKHDTQSLLAEHHNGLTAASCDSPPPAYQQ